MPFVLPYVKQKKLIDGYDLTMDWWVPPNRALVATQLKVVQCPSSPFPNRMQDKPESPINKTGACGDYFTPTGVHLDINQLLPAAEQFGGGGDLRGVICWYTAANVRNRLADVTDGTANSIMLGECAGREDVWRKRQRFQVDFNGPPRVRARGGAWATTDNAFEIGQRAAWDAAFGPITGQLGINNSNEWGHCFYAFHSSGANFAFVDGSIRLLSESTNLRMLANFVTRAGGESAAE